MRVTTSKRRETMAGLANRVFGLTRAMAVFRPQTGLRSNLGLSHEDIIHELVAEVNGPTC